MAAEEFMKQSSKLDILVNNAGVMMIPEYTETKVPRCYLQLLVLCHRQYQNMHLHHNIHPRLLRMASKCNGVPTTLAIFSSPTSFFQHFRSYFCLVSVHSASIFTASSPTNLFISKLQGLAWSMFLPWRIRCPLLLLRMSCPQSRRLTMEHRITVSCSCTLQ